jgi:hypothetical protein
MVEVLKKEFPERKIACDAMRARAIKGVEDIEQIKKKYRLMLISFIATKLSSAHLTFLITLHSPKAQSPY